jgi:hypothetical protein
MISNNNEIRFYRKRTGKRNTKNAMRTKKIGRKTKILYIVTKNDIDNNK